MGIGRAICQIFAANGASVVVADVQKQAAHETKDSLQSGDQRHSAFHVDVSGANFVDQLKDIVLNEYNGKPPDIIVNNAGVLMDRKMHDMDEHAFNWVIDINLKGPFLVTKVFTKAMVDAKLSGGSVINISSIIGKSGNIGQVNYAASKSGLIGMTKTVARELAQYNIRCNAIMPGYINTAMAAKVPPKLAEMILKQIPLRRYGEPKELAQACLFLASDMSSYVTGAVLEVTGGLLM